MTAGIHDYSAPHAPGDADHLVNSAEASSGGPLGSQGSGQTRAESEVIAILAKLVESLAHTNDQGIKACVRKEQVAPESEREPRYRHCRTVLQCERDILGAGRTKHRSGPADAIGGPARERLVLAHFAPHQCAERPRERRIACRAHAREAARAKACHSCNERTSPGRLFIAMMASHAAEAADIVVV